MARARNIKPGFFRNCDLIELAFEARLLFIGLWTLADRDGRMEDKPKQIKIEIFPSDSVDCDQLLNDLARIGVIQRYEVDGKRYLHVVNFCKHQNPHRDEKASSIPIPIEQDSNTVQTQCKHDANTVAIGLIPDSLLLIPDSLKEQGAEKGAKTTAIASRLPKDWTPSDDDFSFCRNERPDLTPSEVASRFRDYWIGIPGAKGRKLDWPATWRNWVRNEKKINGNATQHDRNANFMDALLSPLRNERDVTISTPQLGVI